MEENRVSDTEELRRASSPDEGIRVTDRRRFKMDGETNGAAPSGGGSGQAQRLKPTYVEELETRTLEAERKVAEIQSRFEQLRAALQRETDETRQRLNRAADERATREKAEFVAELLPVRDNLQRAIEAAEQGGGLETLLEGLRGTLSNFESALAAAGVEPVLSVGQRFDPELHEAVDTVPVQEDRDGIVTGEYSRGYKMGGRLVRPARVQVGRAQIEARQVAE